MCMSVCRQIRTPVACGRECLEGLRLPAWEWYVGWGAIGVLRLGRRRLGTGSVVPAI